MVAYHAHHVDLVPSQQGGGQEGVQQTDAEGTVGSVGIQERAESRSIR